MSALFSKKSNVTCLSCKTKNLTSLHHVITDVLLYTCGTVAWRGTIMIIDPDPLTPQSPSWSPVGTACRRSRSLNAEGAPGRGRESPRTRVTMLAVGKRTQRARTSKHITAHTQVCYCMFCHPFLCFFFVLFMSCFESCHMKLAFCILIADLYSMDESSLTQF